MTDAVFKVNSFFVILLMIEWRASDSIVVNWCNKSTFDTSWQVKVLANGIHHARPARHSCYFYVRCANDECNVALPDDKFKFNLRCAREKCGEYGATLPTILDQEEMLFVFQGVPSFGDKSPVVLGMTKVPGKAEVERWDDGLTSAYKPTWNGADQHDNLTYITMPSGELQWSSESFESENFYSVYCKQNVTNLRPIPPFV